MGSGKCTGSGYSRFLFPAIPKKNGKLLPEIDLSLLNQFIKKQPFETETVKSVRQSILVNDWAVSIDLTDAYLHVPIHHHSRKYLRFAFKNQVFQFTVLPFGMSLSLWMFTKLIDEIFLSTCLLTLSIPRRLAYKRSNMQQTYISHNILPPNSSRSRIHSKPKKVRFETNSAIHLHKDGISDTTEYSQGTTRLYRIPTSDCQKISNLDSSFGMNFPFSFGQTQCSRLSCSRQTSFTATTNVSIICLETSYFTTGSSSSDK